MSLVFNRFAIVEHMMAHQDAICPAAPCALPPDSGSARQFVRGVPAERNEVGHLVWIDAGLFRRRHH